ncbi:related to importin beta-2 subunit (transportin) [Cephalotrichum gorgonifer]|uniref:Related to importin beta-2 subunit (Transportin) n=1 Tax=Cephalotrichum gorgonifer TaxID=2041049 RepID=A0AAE8SS63_9PEZI|nr:related to importin beta-2 subunit (transportin) [Cephalotrichum gorgonifer]
MPTWQPIPESLNQLCGFLRDSLSAWDKTAQKQAEMMLLQARSSPDINNYLAYIASNPELPPGVTVAPDSWGMVRSSAAFMLKNNVRTNYKKIPAESLAYVKLGVLAALQDPQVLIRTHVSVVATELIKRGGLLSWPELLPTLMSMLSNETGQFSDGAQEGAMSAMRQICEDSPKMLDRELNGQRPLNFVLPKLIEATKSPLPRVRTQALQAINIFVPRKSQAMLNSIDDLLQHLFILATDVNADVRREVCKAFVQLVDARPDKLEPHISGLVDYILSQQKSDDPQLALEASDFWLAVGEHDKLWQALDPYIQQIIPVLLECMAYTGDDIALLGLDSDDESEEDRAEDIKPAHAKKSSARNINKAGNAQDATAKATASFDKLLQGMGDDFEEGEIEESDDDDDEEEDPEERWTLRKSSAAALDVFARDFKGRVFECILPFLTNNLKSPDWPLREAAVLALGAVSEGCLDVVSPHLGELIPYLVTLLSDSEVVVRQITCWTLSRYSSWAASLTDPAQKSQYFEPIVDNLLQRMLDKNKKVQEAAASAIANLQEVAGKQIEPYAGPIIQQFVRCFGKFKDKNMYILYDCVQTLAEQIGPVLAKPELVNALMPALIDRYQKVPDDSREIFALLECLSYVATALNDAFRPYAEPIFQRCVHIIHANLEQSMAATSNPAIDQPDKDFLITSLDLLSAIIQALDGNGAAELVNSTNGSLFELLGLCLEDLTDEVRQSAYALLGDCARYVFPQLQPYLQSILPMILKQLDFENVLDEDIDGSFAVINNACWSAGEIALQHKKGMAPFVPDLLQRFVELMGNPRVPPSLVENASIALGRLGLDNAELLAPALPTFSEEFLAAMEDVDASEEKATAFKGFTMIVGQNPQAMEKTLLQFFAAIARYRDLTLRNPIKQELHDVFQQAINTYKQMIPQFNDFLAQLAPADRQALTANYVV